MVVLKKALKLHQTGVVVVLLPGSLDKRSHVLILNLAHKKPSDRQVHLHLFYTQTRFLFGLADVQKAWPIPNEAKKQEVC